MKHGTALSFKGYVTSDSTGHATRSTTGAMHVVIDCGGTVDAILKPVNSHSGPKLLVNELVCGELAFRLGLPCLEPILVEVPPSLRIPLRLTPGFMAAGPNFAIPYLPASVAPPDQRHIDLADNPGDLPGVHVFDVWISNRDRTTPGNLVAAEATHDRYHIWMIDHGHAFTGPSWTADSLRLAAEVVEPLPQLDVLRGITRNRASDKARWLDRVATVGATTIAEIVSLVPNAWLPERAERDALTRFLYRRCRALDSLLVNADMPVGP